VSLKEKIKKRAMREMKSRRRGVNLRMQATVCGGINVFSYLLRLYEWLSIKM
jgi:hypothetical protein